MPQALHKRLVYKIVVSHSSTQDFTEYCDTMDKLAAVYLALRNYNLFLGINRNIHIYNFVKVDHIIHAAWLEWTYSQYKELKDMVGVD